MTTETGLFGTDGIRGRVGSAPIIPTVILKLGWAIGSVFSTKDQYKKILVGKDTRISGYLMESALESGLSASGANISLVGPMPSAGVAYLTRSARACAGIVITASHNGYKDNGIKVFSSDGHKISESEIFHINQKMKEEMSCVDLKNLGRALRFEDAQGRYIEYCKSTFPLEYSLSGLKIVLDCAHGASYSVAPKVFSELGADVNTIASSPDGFNINSHCGTMHPEKLIHAVKKQKADIGISFDGDADRLLVIDEKGNCLSGDHVLYVLAICRKNRGDSSSVVGTIMTNLGVETALLRNNISFHRADVGDRYVHKKLVEEEAVLGGEPSGHILCLDKGPSADGIVAALEFLQALCELGNPPVSSMVKDLTLLPQIITSVRLNDRSNTKWSENNKIKDILTQKEISLNKKGGRILIRNSGTEPLIRIMVEGVDQELVNSVSRELTAVIQSVVNEL